MGDFPLPSICPTSFNIIIYINSFCVHINIHMYILRYFCKYNDRKKNQEKGQLNLTLKKETNVFCFLFLKKKKDYGFTTLTFTF